MQVIFIDKKIDNVMKQTAAFACATSYLHLSLIFTVLFVDYLRFVNVNMFFFLGMFWTIILPTSFSLPAFCIVGMCNGCFVQKKTILKVTNYKSYKYP